MLEPETVAILKFSESSFALKASSFLRVLGVGGGTGAGAGGIFVMVEGGCSVAVNDCV